MTQIKSNVQQTAPFDIELISKSIKFPVKFDGYEYVFDRNNHIIAQKCSNTSRETIQDFVNCVNDVYFDIIDGKHDTNLIQNEPNLFTLNEQDMMICQNSVEIISICAWGRYQYFSNGEEMETNVGKFLTFCCNCNKFDVALLS